MTSNIFNADDMPSEEEVRETLVKEIDRKYQIINEDIDGMTSSELKRVLKAITYIHQAGHLLYNEEVELSEKESKLIDRIYSFQDPILMLQSELLNMNSEEGEENE